MIMYQTPLKYGKSCLTMSKSKKHFGCTKCKLWLLQYPFSYMHNNLKDLCVQILNKFSKILRLSDSAKNPRAWKLLAQIKLRFNFLVRDFVKFYFVSSGRKRNIIWQYAVWLYCIFFWEAVSYWSILFMHTDEDEVSVFSLDEPLEDFTDKEISDYVSFYA